MNIKEFTDYLQEVITQNIANNDFLHSVDTPIEKVYISLAPPATVPATTSYNGILIFPMMLGAADGSIVLTSGLNFDYQLTNAPGFVKTKNSVRDVLIQNGVSSHDRLVLEIDVTGESKSTAKIVKEFTGREPDEILIAYGPRSEPYDVVNFKLEAF